MAVAKVTALIAAIVGKRFGLDGRMTVRIYVVNLIIPVSMRFFGHIKCTFGAHVQH